jgi:GNAT superfamily N-acetyltransferase
MPILGINVPEERVRASRVALEKHLLGSIHPTLLVWRQLGRIFLRRTPYTGDYTLWKWDTTSGYEQVAKFGILPLPGCKAICVFHHAVVEPEFRGIGLGKELLQIRLKAANEIGYNIVLATTLSTNAREIKLLENNGFVKASWYYKEGKMVYLWMRISF